MANITLALPDGLKIGEEVHKEAELREASAGDMIAAMSDTEKVIATPEGYQIAANPALVGIAVLGRQIVRIGTHKGPLTMAEMGYLSAMDLSLLQAEADKLEQAALNRIAERGRHSAPSK